MIATESFNLKVALARHTTRDSECDGLLCTSRLAGIYRAPRDGTFWLRDFWSAVEDYERRLLLFYGKDHVTDHSSIDGICADKDGIAIVWGS